MASEKGITSQKIIKEMLKHNIVLRIPSPRVRKVKLRITQVEKGKPRIYEK